MKKKILTVAAMLIASFTFAGMDTTAYSKVVEARFGGGMYDEVDEEEKPVDKVEHIEKKEVKKETKKTKKTKKAAKKKTKKNKKSTKKDKKKKNKVIFNEVIFMTDEEEAARWGYTLEEWEALPDEEKFGTIEGSTAGEVGVTQMNIFDWD